MTSSYITALRDTIKPDGHGNNPLAVELHKLACQLQEQTDKLHAALTEVTKPSYKGEVQGELVPWDQHHPLMLDHTGTVLHGIYAGNADVGEWVMVHWEAAQAYLEDRYGEPASEHTARVVRQMDKSDLGAELAA